MSLARGELKNGRRKAHLHVRSKYAWVVLLQIT